MTEFVLAAVGIPVVMVALFALADVHADRRREHDQRSDAGGHVHVVRRADLYDWEDDER